MTVNSTENVDLTHNASPISYFKYPYFSFTKINELSLQSDNVTNVEQVFQ